MKDNFNNPADQIREKLEKESAGIVDLINKHPESNSLQKIGDYIESLQALIEVQTAQMSVKRYINEKNEYNNFSAPQRQEIRADNFRPETNHHNNVNNYQTTNSSTGAVFYQLSKKTVFNVTKMNFMKENQVFFENNTLTLTDNELSRLKSFLNSDFSLKL
jgi:hypothetical protein